jgi:hypothetical protein
MDAQLLPPHGIVLPGYGSAVKVMSEQVDYLSSAVSMTDYGGNSWMRVP